MVSVSIIIPVYNVEPYVEECVRSVMAQTYEGDIECIIVDDCGTDNSIAICERLISEYTGPIKFSILHHECNRGLSAARNTGIDAATGDYIYFIDSDDYIYPYTIKTLAQLANKYTNVNIIVGYIKSDSPTYHKYSRFNLPNYITDSLQIQQFLFYVCPVMAWNKLYSRNFIIDKALYFPEGYNHEDEYWLFLYYSYINSITYTEEQTYYYRIRTDSIMGQSDKNTQNLNILKVVSKVLLSGKYKDSLYSTISLFLNRLRFSYEERELDLQYISTRKSTLKKICKNRKVPIRIRFISFILAFHNIPIKLFNKLCYSLYFLDWIYIRKHPLLYS